MPVQEKFKIGYFADGPWGHKTLELLLQDNSLDVRFVVPRTDTSDNTLRRYAEKYDIDYLHPVKINSDEFYSVAQTYDCDLFVSMSFNQIFRKRIMELPRLHTINCHAGKLPFYRGRNILNWALINDEKEFGITVHFIDEGIDTGDIILQRTFPITDSDSYKTLLSVAFDECAITLYDAVKEIQQGSFTRLNQKEIHPVGFYCGKRGHGDEVINWDQSSRDVFNFIRAVCDPGPMASTSLKGETVRINKASIVPKAPQYKNTVGQLLSKTESGFLVKTKDTFIEISEIHSPVKLKVGDRFGS